MVDLGKWAVLDIETSGIDPQYDSIIDVGYLQFEGTKLIKKYQSLVQYPPSECLDSEEIKLSQFIQKLTGITPKMVKNAPTWDLVEPDVLKLMGHSIVAHNAGFEESFLKHSFDLDEVPGQKRESYIDTLYFLGLLFPERSSLGLEKFIVEWELREKEKHRGFEDSVDLLKCLLVAVELVRLDKLNFDKLKLLFTRCHLESCWFYKFLSLDSSSIRTIGDQIEFDLEEALKKSVKRWRHLISVVKEK